MPIIDRSGCSYYDTDYPKGAAGERGRKSASDSHPGGVGRAEEQGIREDSIRAVEHIPAREGRYEEYPQEAHAGLVEALQDRGFARLYSHQRQTWELLRQEKNAVVVTPTASGKTLCYNLPVLDSILNNPSARSIYLFPTKAPVSYTHLTLPTN